MFWIVVSAAVGYFVELWPWGVAFMLGVPALFAATVARKNAAYWRERGREMKDLRDWTFVLTGAMGGGMIFTVPCYFAGRGLAMLFA